MLAPVPGILHRAAAGGWPGMALRVALLAIPLLTVVDRRAEAQTVTLGTPSVPARLSIITATAGQPPTSATLAAGTWTGQTSGGGGSHKISARIIGGSIPPGVTVTITITSSGGSVPGTRTLSGSSVDLVTGLARSMTYSGTVTYGISATAAAGVVAPSTLSVQFVID